MLPLHSMVPAADQRKIFVRPPPGVRKVSCSSLSPDWMPHINSFCYLTRRHLPSTVSSCWQRLYIYCHGWSVWEGARPCKHCSQHALSSQLAAPRHADGVSDAVTPPQIVLATNIAETAVTIDDIVCVINSGRMKEKGYDPYMVRPLGASFHLGLSLRHAIARCPKEPVNIAEALSQIRPSRSRQFLLFCAVRKYLKQKLGRILHSMHAFLDPDQESCQLRTYQSVT